MSQRPDGHTPPSPPPYGPAQGYGAPSYGVPVPPDHHQAMLVLVLGIVGMVACQVVSPFAWVMGNRVVREIDASQGRLGGRGAAQVGQILGIIGTVILVAGVLVLIFGFVFFFAAIAGTA